MAATKRASTLRLDGQRLLEARQRAGLSREKLAELSQGELSLSVATIKRAEKSRPVHLTSARALAELLGEPLEGLALAEGTPERPRPSTSVPTAPMQRPPLIGRAAELDQLIEAFACAKRGEPRVVILSGEAGIGKTRLTRELCLRITSDGGLWCMGQGYERGGFPLQPVVEALSPHRTRLLARASPDDRAAVESLLDPAMGVHTGDGVLERQHLALSALFRALAHRQSVDPTVLVLEDLQWLDERSLDALERIAFSAVQAAWRGDACPLLLLGTTRPMAPGAAATRVVERLERDAICACIRLTGLGPDATLELLQSLGVHEPSAAFVGVLHQATGGNPFFVQEAVRYLRARGALDEDAALETVLDLQLPESVTATVRHRLEALDERCRQALIHGACLGFRFELSTLAAVMEVDAADLVDPLEDAIDEGLLDSEGQSFYFQHALIRHVAYQLPSGPRRRRLQRAIDQKLVTLGKPPPISDTREIAPGDDLAARADGARGGSRDVTPGPGARTRKGAH